jgi:hypothetical protein
MNVNNQPETPAQPVENGREMSTTPLFPGLGSMVRIPSTPEL